MLTLKTFVAGTMLAAVSIGAFAQATAPVTPRVDAREAKQQARINAGVASGELNAKEANRLDRQQDRVETAESRAKADGAVTGKERRHLKRMQNRTSENIREQKHDAQKARP